MLLPIRLLMLALPVVIAVGVLAYAGTRGTGVLKKQGVAWGLTALMIVAAIGIGFAKAPVFNDPTSEPGLDSPDTAYHIYDDAGVLSYSTLSQLVNRNARLLDRYGVAIGVVTCNYGRDDLYNYALKRAEELDLRGYDFLVVLDIRGDNYWLVQGADLVYDFTDEDCGDYAYEYMERDSARGNYDAAVLDLTEMLELWYGIYFG